MTNQSQQMNAWRERDKSEYAICVLTTFRKRERELKKKKDSTDHYLYYDCNFGCVDIGF